MAEAHWIGCGEKKREKEKLKKKDSHTKAQAPSIITLQTAN